MPSFVFHRGLQSCLDPDQPIDRRHVVLRLTTKTTSHNKKDDIRNNNMKNIDDHHHYCNSKSQAKPAKGDFSFLLQELSINPCRTTKDHDIYVHPLVKRSSSTLSTKSLEMCTESLGNETGINISQTSNSLIESDHKNPRKQRPSNMQERWEKKKLVYNKERRRSSSSNNYRPALMKRMCDPGRVKLEPHRENGRLVLREVAVDSYRGSQFHVERGNGRLRLHLLEDCWDEYCGDHKNYKRVCEKEEEEKGEEDKDVIYGNVGGKMGREKFANPRRCKEGEGRGKGMLHQEQFWVAT